MTLDSPYKGLVPFEDSELDALLFFGRERESGIIGENLLAARLTVLYGPSGVGKTSVLRAGVAFRLREQARHNVEARGHPEYVVVVVDVWSEDPVDSLRSAVRDELGRQFGSALLDERVGESLAETFGRWTDALACDLLLILDQAEEHFLYHQGEGGFTAELPELVTRPGLRVRVLLSLRDDALSKLDRFKGRIPNLFANYLRLDHLDRRSARDAVEKPVERYNELVDGSIEVEPELTAMVLDQTVAGQVDLGETGRGMTTDDVSAGRIEAAYLQLVLERLWEEEQAAGSSRLRPETLVALGGAEAIVRTHLRRAVEELTTEERDIAAEVFRFLVTPSGTKIAHGVGDLAEYASVEEQRLLPVLSTLGRERIVRTVNGAGDEAARYEIFHDVLGEAVLAWRREQELERERRTAAQRHKRLAIVAVLALVALAAMTAVAIYALAQRREARDSARDAGKSAREAQAGELVARSSDMLNEDPLESVALAAQAARLEPNAGSVGALRLGLLVSHLRRVLRAGSGPVNAAAYDPRSTMVVTADADGTARLFSTTSGDEVAILRHDGGVTDASFSPDGKTIASASRDRMVTLWDRDGKLLRTLRHDAPVLDLEFSPTEPFLVTVTVAGTVHIWGLEDRSHTILNSPPGRDSVTISADGKYATVYGADNVARVYRVPSGDRVFELRHDSRVLSAAFGPKKELLATGSVKKAAYTWDLRQGRRAHTFEGFFGQVVDVAVSPAGQFAGAASTDGTARIFDIAVKRGELIAIPTGHRDQLHTIEFSPGGLYVLTSSRDGTARVWKTDRGNEIAVLAGHDGDVRGASFSRTGRRVLTYSEDGTARIWDSGTAPELRVLSHEQVALTGLDVADDGRIRVTTDANGVARVWRRGLPPVALPVGNVRDARISPSGDSVATASGDRRVRIWSTEGRPTLEFPTEDTVDVVVFSPDGRRLASSGRKGITLSNLRQDTGPEQLIDSGPGTVDLSFSPDGERLVAANADGKARIWDLATSKLTQTLVGHRDRLTSAEFSPNGKLVVTASADHDAIVWDAQTGKPSRPLRGHGAIVSDAGFSSDGRWVVTAGPGRGGLWDVRTGKLLTFLDGHLGQLKAAEFGEHGYTVFTAGVDGTVRTYTCLVCAPLPELLALADRRLAVATGARR